MQKTRAKTQISHGLAMLLCCLIPLIIAGILFYLGFKTYATLVIMLLCPILHYFMMRNMHGKHGNKNEGEGKDKKCH